MRYRFFCPDDEKLIALSELPVEQGAAVALLTTGYTVGKDEIVEISIADLEGHQGFNSRVKPQNVEDWRPGEASGGISPADVEELPELYQFEEEISDLIEGAEVVVAEHLGFAKAMVESSWVSLPEFSGFDLVEEFCATHADADMPDEAAPVASLAGIAEYYGVQVGSDTRSRAAAIGACYRKLIGECAQARLDKGAEYWQAYQRRLDEAAAGDLQAQAAERSRQIKTLRVNAVMWLCTAAILSNLAVQLHVRSFDIGVVVLVAAFAVFGAVRWIQCLYRMYKMRSEG